MRERDVEVGSTIDGRYVLTRAIARGAMGVVFEASHAYTGRVAAVKVLPRERSGDASARERLLREARALGSIRHPNVVEVLDAGVDEDGQPFVAMEMLEGRTLDGILTSGRALTIGDAVVLGRTLCDALDAVHRAGVVHRDIKPGNVLVARGTGGEDVIKLIDFGIARIGKAAAATPRADGPPPRKLTKDGELLGTPEYMAPEQLTLEPAIDGRCDLYALGVLLFECLVGDVPHGGTYPEVLVKVSASEGAPAIRARREDVPAALAAVVERALAKQPSDRHPDAAAFARALDAAMPGAPRSLRLLGLGAGDGPEPTRRGLGPEGTLFGLQGPEPPARRRFARAPYVTPVRILRAGGELLDGRTEDVSEGGLFALVPYAIRDGERVRVEFAPPGSGACVAVTATARWVRAARGGKGAIGIEFDELPEQARAAVASYVAWMNG